MSKVFVHVFWISHIWCLCQTLRIDCQILQVVFYIIMHNVLIQAFQFGKAMVGRPY